MPTRKDVTSYLSIIMIIIFKAYLFLQGKPHTFFSIFKTCPASPQGKPHQFFSKLLKKWVKYYPTAERFKLKVADKRNKLSKRK